MLIVFIVNHTCCHLFFRWSLKYPDYTLCKEVIPPCQRGVLGMTRNCIWQWAYSSGAQGNIEYHFIAIIPKSTLTQRVSSCRVPPMSQIDLFNSSYHQISCINYHHHVVPLARISLTLSRHSSLSFIASCRSSRQHPVSSHSCWMYVRAGLPAFARPCVGVHESTSLMSSSLLLLQYPACLVRLTWIVFVIGGRWPYSWCLVGVAARTCSRLLAAFLCNCRLASSPAVLLESM